MLSNGVVVGSVVVVGFNLFFNCYVVENMVDDELVGFNEIE